MKEGSRHPVKTNLLIVGALKQQFKGTQAYHQKILGYKILPFGRNRDQYLSQYSVAFLGTCQLLHLTSCDIRLLGSMWSDVILIHFNYFQTTIWILKVAGTDLQCRCKKNTLPNWKIKSKSQKCCHGIIFLCECLKKIQPPECLSCLCSKRHTTCTAEHSVWRVFSITLKNYISQSCMHFSFSKEGCLAVYCYTIGHPSICNIYWPYMQVQSSI